MKVLIVFDILFKLSDIQLGNIKTINNVNKIDILENVFNKKYLENIHYSHNTIVCLL